MAVKEYSGSESAASPLSENLNNYSVSKLLAYIEEIGVDIEQEPDLNSVSRKVVNLLGKNAHKSDDVLLLTLNENPMHRSRPNTAQQYAQLSREHRQSRRVPGNAEQAEQRPRNGGLHARTVRADHEQR